MHETLIDLNKKFHKNVIPVHIPHKENHVTRIHVDSRSLKTPILVAFVKSPRALEIHTIAHGTIYEPLNYLTSYLLRRDVFKIKIRMYKND